MFGLEPQNEAAIKFGLGPRGECDSFQNEERCETCEARGTYERRDARGTREAREKHKLREVRKLP